MIKRQFFGFLARWIFSSLGMWFCITMFGSITGNYSVELFILAGLIFSLINSFVRPLAVIMTLPLIIFATTIVTIIINTVMVALAFYLTPDVSMDGKGIILSSIVMSLVNGVVNFWITPYTKR